MLDELDIKILNSLSNNSNSSRKEIAFHLGISESYLSKKVKELSEFSRYIKYFTIEIDYEKAGYDTNAISVIKISTKGDKDLSEVIEECSKINEAVQVSAIFGDWDIFIRWMCKSNSELMDRIVFVRNITDIKEMMTITLGRLGKDKRGPKII